MLIMDGHPHTPGHRMFNLHGAHYVTHRALRCDVRDKLASFRSHKSFVFWSAGRSALASLQRLSSPLECQSPRARHSLVVVMAVAACPSSAAASGRNLRIAPTGLMTLHQYRNLSGA